MTLNSYINNSHEDRSMIISKQYTKGNKSIIIEQTLYIFKVTISFSQNMAKFLLCYLKLPLKLTFHSNGIHLFALISLNLQHTLISFNLILIKLLHLFHFGLCRSLQFD